ncbi:hypothetical protein NLX83_19890 [Allokutzneria sp. A3M-2-11 16]|uniref:hypothetical protein n=1 Tax=Allokutzneria sp. A3M-2-11 16 TaxID=2962043 RepID=UPI0020B659CF|nr:hypothetical protein [Allokutzneria sp. A3M-2-11 16]MCP3801525.1 hypothetical protein [Allokutzneria sp. A3M-2-11 16]
MSDLIAPFLFTILSLLFVAAWDSPSWRHLRARRRSRRAIREIRSACPFARLVVRSPGGRHRARPVRGLPLSTMDLNRATGRIAVARHHRSRRRSVGLEHMG